jgi:hypothetical protein
VIGDGVGDRQKIAGGRGQAGHLPLPRRELLAGAGEGLTTMVNSMYNG